MVIKLCNMISEKMPYREVRDYLNYLTELKKKAILPFSLEIEDGLLYHIRDGAGNLILTLSKDIYNIFQEL